MHMTILCISSSQSIAVSSKINSHYKLYSFLLKAKGFLIISASSLRKEPKCLEDLLYFTYALSAFPESFGILSSTAETCVPPIFFCLKYWDNLASILPQFHHRSLPGFCGKRGSGNMTHEHLNFPLSERPNKLKNRATRRESSLREKFGGYSQIYNNKDRS